MSIELDQRRELFSGQIEFAIIRKPLKDFSEDEISHEDELRPEQ